MQKKSSQCQSGSTAARLSQDIIGSMVSLHRAFAVSATSSGFRPTSQTRLRSRRVSEGRQPLIGLLGRFACVEDFISQLDESGARGPRDHLVELMLRVEFVEDFGS